MSRIKTVMPTSFKVEILRGVHNFSFGGDTFKLALYGENAVLNENTTAYTPENEVPASGSYAPGGGVLVNITPTAFGTSGVTSFETLSFTNTTITAYGAMIYNDSVAGKPAVAILDFAGAKTSTNSSFTIIFPPVSGSSAIIRIS